jgi:hypothetical protein
MTIMTLPPVFISANWGDEMVYEEEKADNKFVVMPRVEWEHQKQLAKIEKRFRSWGDWLSWVSRIDNKRREAHLPVQLTPEPTKLRNLMNLRDEYVRFPAMHFSDGKSRTRALAKLEKEIEAEVGGVSALKRAKMDDPAEDPVETESVADSDESDEEFDLFIFARGY